MFLDALPTLGTTCWALSALVLENPLLTFSTYGCSKLSSEQKPSRKELRMRGLIGQSWNSVLSCFTSFFFIQWGSIRCLPCARHYAKSRWCQGACVPAEGTDTEWDASVNIIDAMELPRTEALQSMMEMNQGSFSGVDMWIEFWGGGQAMAGRGQRDGNMRMF